mgnify:CR=1 FL=1
MTLTEFRRALATLINYDTADTIKPALGLDGNAWGRWLDDPVMQFLMLDLPEQEKVWNIMQRRINA